MTDKEKIIMIRHFSIRLFFLAVINPPLHDGSSYCSECIHGISFSFSLFFSSMSGIMWRSHGWIGSWSIIGLGTGVFQVSEVGRQTFCISSIF
jgi:hypothetical protein